MTAYINNNSLINRYGTSVTNDYRYVPLVVSTFRFFHHAWLMTGFVTRVTRRMPLVEQELLTLLGHQSSPPGFSGFRVARALDLCVMVCRSLFVLFLLAIVLIVLRFTDSDYIYILPKEEKIYCINLLVKTTFQRSKFAWRLNLHEIKPYSIISSKKTLMD